MCSVGTQRLLEVSWEHRSRSTVRGQSVRDTFPRKKKTLILQPQRSRPCAKPPPKAPNSSTVVDQSINTRPQRFFDRPKHTGTTSRGPLTWPNRGTMPNRGTIILCSLSPFISYLNRWFHLDFNWREGVVPHDVTYGGRPVFYFPLPKWPCRMATHVYCITTGRAPMILASAAQALQRTTWSWDPTVSVLFDTLIGGWVIIREDRRHLKMRFVCITWTMESDGSTRITALGERKSHITANLSY